jgi:hypothetical protein
MDGLMEIPWNLSELCMHANSDTAGIHSRNFFQADVLENGTLCDNVLCEWPKESPVWSIWIAYQILCMIMDTSEVFCVTL